MSDDCTREGEFHMHSERCYEAGRREALAAIERVRALAVDAKARDAASLSRTFDGGTFGPWLSADDVLAALRGDR